MSLRRCTLLLSTLVALLVAVPAAAQTASFSDVNGHFHRPSIDALAAEQVVNGCTDDRFCPERHLTRAQLASMLVRSLGLELSSADDSDRFRDIDHTVHADAIVTLAEEGLTSGCASDRFCPDDPITRGQLGTLLSNALALPAAPDRTYFADVSGVHRPGIDAMAEHGVAAGCTLIHFCASDTLTRAHAATFVARGLELVDRVQLASYEDRRAEHEAQNGPGQKAVEVALAQVGKPYRYGGSGPSNFDCSGLTSYAWRAAGVEIPRTSRDQKSWTRSITRGQLQPGDLVFFRDPVGHVAMYIGDGKVVEAPSSNKTVRVNSRALSRTDITGYGRVR